MTQSDKISMAIRIIDINGVGEVARKIDKSPATVSQVKNGKYAGNPARIVELIMANFTDDTIICPIMGEIPISDCLDARKRVDMPYIPSSGQTTALYKTCPSCPNNPKTGGHHE